MHKKFRIEVNSQENLLVYMIYPDKHEEQIGVATLQEDQETYRISGELCNLTLRELEDLYLLFVGCQVSKWNEEERMILKERRDKNERD